MNVPPDAINDRINRLEWNAERQEERMNMGSESFADVRQSLNESRETIHKLNRRVEEATGPRPVDWKWIAGFGLTIVCVAASAIWAFAKYPDASDFSLAQKANVKAHRAIDHELNSLRTEQALNQQTLTAQEKSLDSIDGKLDQLLLPRPNRKR